MLEKITKSLNITIPPHVLRSRDPRALLTTVFASWLPLSIALKKTLWGPSWSTSPRIALFHADRSTSSVLR